MIHDFLFPFTYGHGALFSENAVWKLHMAWIIIRMGVHGVIVSPPRFSSAGLDFF